MALSLSIPTEFGINATYHRLAALQANWADGGCTGVMYSYLDESARQSGAKPLGTVQVQLTGVVEGELTRAALYAAIKAQPDWATAVDA